MPQLSMQWLAETRERIRIKCEEPGDSAHKASAPESADALASAC
jgi:hypothetical protein